MKSLELSYAVQEFKSICESWEKYKEELKDDVSLSVQSVKKSVTYS